MTTKDILHYAQLQRDVESLINKYITEFEIPATMQRPIFAEALNAIVESSKSEIQSAVEEEQEKSNDIPAEEVYGDDCQECAVGGAE